MFFNEAVCSDYYSQCKKKQLSPEVRSEETIRRDIHVLLFKFSFIRLIPKPVFNYETNTTALTIIFISAERHPLLDKATPKVCKKDRSCAIRIHRIPASPGHRSILSEARHCIFRFRLCGFLITNMTLVSQQRDCFDTVKIGCDRLPRLRSVDVIERLPLKT